MGADRDRNLSMLNQIKNAKGGLEVDWSEFTGKGIDPSAVAGGKAREQVAMPVKYPNRHFLVMILLIVVLTLAHIQGRPCVVAPKTHKKVH